jgi:hypothetical protein
MAFPVNGVLDNFNRANATPMGGSWSGKIRSADIDASINGNVAHANAAGNASAVWSPAVADDQEAYATVVTADVSDTLEVWVRLTSAGGAAPNGYRILFTDNAAGSDTLQLYRVNGGVFTQLGSTFTGTIASAQKIGIDAVGTTISAYSTTAACGRRGSRRPMRRGHRGRWRSSRPRTTASTTSAAAHPSRLPSRCSSRLSTRSPSCK